MERYGESSIFTERPVVYATFGQRFGAVLLDTILLGIAQSIVDYIMGWRADYGLTSHFGVHFTGWGIVNWLYFALMESGPGMATLGKRALNIKVTDMEGNRISFGRATGRYFAKILSMIILFIGYLMVLWDSKRQALHDKLANTLVVSNR